MVREERKARLKVQGRWTVPPTRERKGPNPKPEIRGPKEGRNPKSEMPERGFGLRYSAFFRVSALGIRIWAAGGGWCYPDTPELLRAASSSTDRELSRFAAVTGALGFSSLSSPPACFYVLRTGTVRGPIRSLMQPCELLAAVMVTLTRPLPSLY